MAYYGMMAIPKFSLQGSGSDNAFKVAKASCGFQGFRGAEGWAAPASKITQSLLWLWDWATPQVPNYVSALIFFLCKKETNMGKPTHGWLRSSLQKNKTTGKQQVEVLSPCVPASKNALPWILSLQHSRRLEFADSKLGLGNFGRDIRLQHKWLASIVHCLFLFILPLTFYGILHVRPKLECQQAHNVSMGKSLFLCVSSTCLNRL